MLWYPHALYDRCLAAIERTRDRAVDWEGTAYRCVRIHYAHRGEVLSGVGSRRYGGRWNPPTSFRTVYASDSIACAMDEALAHSRRYGIPESELTPLVIVAIEIRLHAVLDLCDPNIRRRIRVSRDRMLEQGWDQRDADSFDGVAEEALTQSIGRAAFVAGYEGLLVPSAVVRDACNLVVFPDKLLAASSMTVVREDRLPSGNMSVC